MEQARALLYSRRWFPPLIITAGFILAVLLGLGVTRFGIVLFGVIAAPLIGLLLFTHPILGLSILIFTLPIEELIPGIGSATGTRLLGMVVFGAWMFRKLFLLESWRPLIKTPLAQAGAAFLLLILASSIWADDPSLVLPGLFTQVQLFFFFLIIVDLVNSWKRADLLARLLLISGLIAALSTMYQYFVLGFKRAGDGISGGINYTACILVTLMPIAFYLLRVQKRGWWKVLSILYIGLGTIAVGVTFSRTSYILLLLVFVANYWESIRGRSGRSWILVLTVLALFLPLLVPQEAITERVETISPVLEQWIGSLEGSAEIADTRAYSWRVGLEMFKQYTLTGVGFNNYGTLFLAYQVEIPGSPQMFDKPRSPHSSFIGIASELGLFGIALWVSILVIALRFLISAGVALKKQKSYDHFYFVQAAGYMILLQVLYGWALNSHMNKIFWLILGMTAVVKILSPAIEESESEQRTHQLSPSIH